jgi:hypothetical protein
MDMPGHVPGIPTLTILFTYRKRRDENGGDDDPDAAKHAPGQFGFLKISEAFVPPKPNEFDSAA